MGGKFSTHKYDLLLFLTMETDVINYEKLLKQKSKLLIIAPWLNLRLKSKIFHIPLVAETLGRNLRSVSLAEIRVLLRTWHSHISRRVSATS